MAAARPPYHEPPPDTIDDAELIIDQTAPPQKSPIQRPLPFAGPGRAPAAPPAPPRPAPPPKPPTPYGEETAAPQRSPLAAALPFRHAKLNVPSPQGAPNPGPLHAPSAAPNPGAPRAASVSMGPQTAPNPGALRAASVSMGPQTAPNPGALRAPEPTMALPMMTPEALAQMMAGGPDASAAAAKPLGGAPDRARLERAKLEQARTVAFAMPPGFDPTAGAAQKPLTAPPGAAPVPSGGGPVAAKSTGHFGLSIEQYAALCAEVAVFPERGEAIFTQYGLAERKDRITADLAWQDRLRADNALMARWQSLYLYYHDYYQRLKTR